MRRARILHVLRALTHLARTLAFAAVNAGAVFAFSVVVCDALPPLRSEPPALVILPMTLIVAVVAVPLHQVVSVLKRSLARAAALYLAFLGTLLLYGIYLSLYQGSGSPEQFALLHPDAWSYVSLVPAALVFGHVLGAPALLGVGLLNKLLSPALTPRVEVGA
ncbi:MAG: hypothetical protein H6719_05960 [Sandaracinaceae bacterium]|nr:hypothetical protein [Sandaracinaceae bacterium]